MLFALIRVHRCFAADGRIEFLDVGGRSFDDCAVGLANASVNDFERFEFRRKGVNEKAKLVHGGLGLDTDAKDEIPVALAVGLEANRGLHEVIDVRFFGVRVVRRMIRRGGANGGGSLRSLLRDECTRRKEGRQQETSRERSAHSILSWAECQRI